MKNTSMDTQKKNLLDKLSSHQESEPQRDDITIVGIKIKD
jgi:serine phosphatase RsbU (regulator of sigma subunit)